MSELMDSILAQGQVDSDRATILLREWHAKELRSQQERRHGSKWVPHHPRWLSADAARITELFGAVLPDLAAKLSRLPVQQGGESWPIILTVELPHSYRPKGMRIEHVGTTAELHLIVPRSTLHPDTDMVYPYSERWKLDRLALPQTVREELERQAIEDGLQFLP